MWHRSIAVLVILALGGCASRAPAPALEPPGAWTTRELTSPGGFLTITLKIPTAPRGAKPVVINPIADEGALLGHGIIVARYSADWGKLSALRADAGSDGHAVESEDERVAETHDEKPAEKNVVGTWLLAAPRPGIVGRNYFQFIRGEARRIVPTVIDRIVDSGEVDADRIGLSGSSTKGFVVLEAMAGDPRIAVAVVRVACGDYRAFLRYSALALGGDERWLTGGRLVLDADYDAELAASEPVGRAGVYPPRPLLLLSGAQDRAIPPQCVEPTVAAFRRAYADHGAQGRFRAVAYEGAGHDLGAPAKEEELRWWLRWLGDDG